MIKTVSRKVSSGLPVTRGAGTFDKEVDDVVSVEDCDDATGTDEAATGAHVDASAAGFCSRGQRTAASAWWLMPSQ
ncbi:hypothetical protein [Amycolatopsis sp. Hca4]|uniref:hypothetical protein n=1 Tax=Amycolatopsis sp. Hca4 TaxID=2742131 RepID=UPI001C3794AF|nr:hypothetical protein [Amycolatopsis sp. Hca4]